MRAVDTNLLLRLVVGDEPAQTAAAEQFVRPGAWVSLLVLMETVWALGSVYRVPAANVADAVEGLLDHNRLVIEDADVVKLALAQYRARPLLGFSDCLILEVARARGHVPLGTFDRGLGKLPGAQKV